MGHPSQSSAFKAAIIFPMKEGGREKGRKEERREGGGKLYLSGSICVGHVLTV